MIFLLRNKTGLRRKENSWRDASMMLKLKNDVIKREAMTHKV
jgi:hypothetical protein